MVNDYLINIDGFMGNAVHSGVKYKNYDLSIIHSENECIAAGVFTKNKTVAAPVIVSKGKINNKIKTIIINSGNANACTGEKGIEDAKNMCKFVSETLKIKESKVLVSSTGVIGEYLPMDKIESSMYHLIKNISYENFSKVPKGIMTTDNQEKICSSEFLIGDKKISINGIAKGSGMIHPNMATMLAFFSTNVNINQKLLQQLVKEITDETFNMISVDGDTSTNDMVILLSNKKAGNKLIEKKDSKAYKILKENLKNVFENLAVKIAKDGEGATKLLEVHLKGAKDIKDARILAKSVINSNLVKSAFFGEDPNWGRILCALGYSGGNIDPEKVTLSFKNETGSVDLLIDGKKNDFDIKLAKKILSKDKIIIDINLNLGNATTKAWGCDLSYDYVKINAEYHT